MLAPRALSLLTLVWLVEGCLSHQGPPADVLAASLDSIEHQVVGCYRLRASERMRDLEGLAVRLDSTQTLRAMGIERRLFPLGRFARSFPIALWHRSSSQPGSIELVLGTGTGSTVFLLSLERSTPRRLVGASYISRYFGELLSRQDSAMFEETNCTP